MTRDIWSGDTSPSTKRPYASRFDYSPQPRDVTNTHDAARQAAYDMSKPEFDLMDYWVRHALVKDVVRAGPFDVEIGGTTVSELRELASADTTLEPTVQQIKGFLLLSGNGYLPTFKTAGQWDWLVGCDYVGLPASGPIRAAFDNLVAQL